MADPAAVARAKIAALRSQIAELETFLEMYERLSEGAASAVDSRENPDETHRVKSSEGNEAPQPPVDKSVESSVFEPDSVRVRTRRRLPGSPRPGDVAVLIERIIREVGRPMTRGEIVAALETRDVVIPYEDKSRYVGTIAWRHKRLFENIDGRGYWLRGVPIPEPSIDDMPPVWRRDLRDEIPDFDPNDPNSGLFG